MTDLERLAAFLDRFFAVRSEGDCAGIWKPSEQPIARLGLLLEPWPGLEKWVAQQQLDALFVHRPWQLDACGLPPQVGVLSYHLAFDERLTVGFNPYLAEALHLGGLELLEEKQGRILGMVGQGSSRSFATLCQSLSQLFGGLEQVIPGRTAHIARIAVVGAMRPALIEEAHRRGATAYITGQMRPGALSAVQATGIALAAVGHHRAESWGLSVLARVLRVHRPHLEVSIAEVG